MKARLTKHQEWVLSRLRLLSGADERWVHERDCGSKRGLEHLLRKGYADCKVERGPRGGEHRYYRPGTGKSARAATRAEIEKVDRNEIDKTLMVARDRGTVVLVYANGTYYRGVPGNIVTEDDWNTVETKVYMLIGQRKVPFHEIERVEVPE